MRPRFFQKRKGAALILTLIVVSMLTILVMAYFVTMRVEMQAAHAYADAQRAKMVAQGAVAHGISLLRENIPDPAPISDSAGTARALNWAVNPGRLTVFDNRGKVRHIDLHTGRAEVDPEQTRDPDVFSADLNEPLPGKAYPAIAMALDRNGRPDPGADIPPMRVKWVPMLRDPSEAPSEENPITGRYAFWMDDESAKINFNVALGKPSRSVVDPQHFWEQYDLGMMTPLFTQGRGDVEYNATSQDREWALGKLRSINLDVLMDHPNDLDRDGLLGHAWLRGFSRYPEAILDFVNLDERERLDWYHGNKFNLTFYSRGPEFNAFGRSRLFTTNIPLSLEAGPLYQLPFVYNGPGVPETDYQIEGVLHLHSLMGSLGFTHGINDGKEKGSVHAANLVNRAQFEMLKRYFGRRWPGYGNASFIDKYGEKECYQMALSLLTMARMATTTMASGGRGGSSDWALRSTSVIYSPYSKERPGATPERHYWQVELEKPDKDGETVIPMLPQVPGPHITEVRLMFRSERPRSGKHLPTERWIGLRYEVEYYMHGIGPVLFLNDFPAKVDYLSMEIQGGGDKMPAFYELGPPDPDAGKKRPDRNWNYNKTKKLPDPTPDDPEHLKTVVDRRSLGSLRLNAGSNVRIGPFENPSKDILNRKMVGSPWRYLGKQSRWLANPEDPKPVADDEPVIVDLAENPNLTIKVKWRLGMGIRQDGGRPRQMIPIGETTDDVLEATFDVNVASGEKEIVSWQINDPRLSWDRDQWIIDTEDEGTPGAINTIKGRELEPKEESSEKSKFRYIQRGGGNVRDPKKSRGRTFPVNRPDEYNSRSRISSKGYWSMLHTGIQNLKPWRTLDLGGGNSNVSDPPDWLLLDLLGATYPMQHDQWRINSTLPDEFSTISFMNSTAGQINLNSRIYPDSNAWFRPPERRKPLEAVFKHLRSQADLETLLDGIEDYQNSRFFGYVGELAEVGGYRRAQTDATQFEDEELLRNMAGCLTTKSNTFGMWGVAQVLKKAKGHDKWGEFEDGDSVRGEKRFYAVIERYLWPGKDGLPGNAHVNHQGIWDRLAQQEQDTAGWSGETTDTLYQLPGSPPMHKGGGTRLALDLKGTYPWYDGPQPVEMDKYVSHTLGKVKWTSSSLEDAYNPPQPVVKYRVVYFKYLDE
ncbi:MAG: hypothetical protein KDN19_09690 [Verrucomicrobiae bacterium]|nr:hypothetical protein [Verrucomicrobiae bacterium]